MAVDITHGMTAGDIVAKLQKRSRLNKDLIRRRQSGLSFTETYFQNGTTSPVEAGDSDDGDNVNPGEQFVFEVGGNIGEWVNHSFSNSTTRPGLTLLPLCIFLL